MITGESPHRHVNWNMSESDADTEDLATKDMSNREASGATSSREVSQSTALPKKAAAIPVLPTGAEQAGSDALDRLSKQQWDQAEVIGEGPTPVLFRSSLALLNPTNFHS